MNSILQCLVFFLLFAQGYASSFKTVETQIYKPKDIAQVSFARRTSIVSGECGDVDWELRNVSAPDIHDKHTLSQLARMAGNAYALPGAPNWYDLDAVWTNFPIGWEDPVNGFRGHVFMSPENNTVILSIKGTTLSGPTSREDRLNDNLLFSCCCAHMGLGLLVRPVCDCYSRQHWRCDNACVSDALIQDSLFYSIGVGLIHNITSLFPTANIHLVGHSLGGSLASLLGTTFGFPAVAFESPGERLAATRLHLPIPPSMRTSSGEPNYSMAPVTHVYHSADPIPNGVCNGFTSPCTHAGYALETRCHLGTTVLYDTVRRLGWSVDIRKHSVREIIHNVIEADILWGFGQKVPKARPEVDCVDCFKWEFGDFGGPSDGLSNLTST